MAKNMANPQTEDQNQNVLDDDFSDSSYDLALNTMSVLFFDPEHINQVVSAAQKSRDPSQVVGTAIGQIAQIAYNKLNQADLGISDAVWAADEGVLDSSIEEVVEFFSETGLELDPPSVATAVVNTLKDSPISQGQQPAAPQGGAPSNIAAPQGVMQ